VVHTPSKYVRASLQTPTGDLDVVADKVREPDGLREVVLEGDIVDDSALETLTDPDTDFDSVADPDTDFDWLTEADTLFESVGSIDLDADTLRLPVELTVSVGSFVDDAVNEAVKLGDTGLFVTEGVTDWVGIIALYDMKNTEPDPRLIILAPVWPPPPS